MQDLTPNKLFEAVLRTIDTTETLERTRKKAFLKIPEKGAVRGGYESTEIRNRKIKRGTRQLCSLNQKI